MSNLVKHVVDAVAGVTALVGVLSHILPVIASALSIAWYAYRFWEVYKGKKNGNVRIN